MSELVSIVIPVYNAKPFLKSCLYSVSNQDYKFIEVIIINDGSTDGSEEIIEKYIKDDKRFKLISQENHGLGYTRNKGISLSNGKYIFFLDSDDVIPPNSIGSLVNAMKKSDADYVVGKVVRFNNKRKYIPVRHIEFNLYNQDTLTNIINSPELIQDSIACNKLWKRDFLIENSLLFHEDRYYEDLVFTMRAAVIAKKIKVISKVVYHWRVREDENIPSITQQQMKLNNTLDRLDALSYNRDWLITSGIQKRIVEEHDLKSLLDILRLHVSKYSLIKEEEKEEFQQKTSSYLKQIPSYVVARLPDKEKELHRLLMNQEYFDLMLFSQMLMNAEKSPIVYQEENEYVLKGKEKPYKVTQYLKPSINVGGIVQLKSEWMLSGDLIIPKSTYKSNGEIFAIGRNNKKKIHLGEMNIIPTLEKSCYPNENLYFELKLNPRLFLDYNNESIFDFYFGLKDYTNYGIARVRLGSKTNSTINIKVGKITFTLYRTNFGNLSLRIQKNSIIKLLAKKLLSYIK